jgi:predicted amidohydrolase
MFGAETYSAASSTSTKPQRDNRRSSFRHPQDRTGRERGVDWAEASVIVDPDGRLLAGPVAGEAVLIAELALERARDKAYGDRNDVLADRRVELYDAALTSQV